MMQMMNGGCGLFMMIFGGISWLLGLGLVVSLSVLVWTVIGWLRRGRAPRRQVTCREDRIIVSLPGGPRRPSSLTVLRPSPGVRLETHML